MKGMGQAGEEVVKHGTGLFPPSRPIRCDTFRFASLLAPYETLWRVAGMVSAA